MASPRPRVVYVLPLFDRSSGTHFRHLYDLLARAASELDILVVAERSRGTPEQVPFRFRAQRFSWAPARFIELIYILFRERSRGAHSVYVHYSFFGGMAAWLAMGLTGGEVFYWNCGMPWRYDRPWITERVFRFILGHTTLVTGTAGIAAAYQRHYGVRPDRTRILPNWITVARFRASTPGQSLRATLGLPADAHVLLFVHRLSRRKGAHRIPHIAALIAREDPHAMVVVVGTGPEEASLKTEALPARIRFLGEVPNEHIPDYFRMADVFVMPSEEEGFPHVLIEAMAAGLPYVATDVGGVREITPHALLPFVVPPNDDEAFADAACRLLALPPDERARLRATLEAAAAEYDVATVLPRFLRLFTA